MRTPRLFLFAVQKSPPDHSGGYCDAATLSILVAKGTLRADDHPPEIHVKRYDRPPVSADISVVDYTG